MRILDNPNLLRDWMDNGPEGPHGIRKIPEQNKVLMVHPLHYKISYSINPHMMDSHGKLREVDTKKALAQWKNLVKTLENCGLEVEIMDSQERFPDMVFTANQSFVYWDTTKNTPEVLLSNMCFEVRKGEVAYFEEYFKAHDYITHKLPQELVFEGTGDALIDNVRKIIFCGYGFRTHPSMPARLCELTGYASVPLKLVNPDFYHLDTCFAPLGKSDVVIVDDAFSDESLDLIYAAFENVIHADHVEAKEYLAANLFCPNGRDVILDHRNVKLSKQLTERGYQVHGVDTGEFLKAGGSVFCLKLFLW